MSQAHLAFGRTLSFLIHVERLVAVIVVLLVGQLVSANAAEQIKIADDRDPRFLPYSITMIDSGGANPCSRLIVHPQRVYREAGPRSDSAVILIARNPTESADSRAMVALMQIPGNTPIRELSSGFRLSDVGVFHTRDGIDPSVWYAGYARDSAWIICFTPGAAKLDSIFAGTGKDQTGDGKWQCYLHEVASFDYDSDGNEEQLFYLNSERDFPPRVLICARLATRQILWTVPMASPVPPGNAVPCGDSTDPGLLVCSYGVGQGHADSEFSDGYGYLVKFDRNGGIRDKKIIAGYSENLGMIRLPVDSSIFVLHTLPFLDTIPNDTILLPSLVSKLDHKGQVVKTLQMHSRVGFIWAADYSGDDRAEVYTMTTDGVVRVFDQQLELLAESNPTSLYPFAGQLPDWAGMGPVLFFEENGQLGVYTPRFDKIAVTPSHQYRETYSRDSSGHVMAFLGAQADRFFVANIERRSLAYMVATVYFDYRRLILGLLSSLLILLIVVNFYRRRVSAQKRQIENAHKELEETHEALKRAQETIIAQEKYRQAKDIAGGFAHEIKNALFPADGALIKQERLLKESAPDADRLKATYATIRGAMARALSLTRQITAYTKLDTEVHKEPVNVQGILQETLAAHDAPIRDRGLRISIVGDPTIMTAIRADHLRSVLINLLLNSIEALEQRESPRISVEWSTTGSQIALKWGDNGCGIAESDVARIFDAFFSTKPTKGTGLGLSTVKRIVELYGGAITVKSRPTEGTTFHLVMPIYDV